MIVSAIPFTGNKRKLWSQIEPLMPEGKCFVDMFMGGGTIALNATTKYDIVYAGDVLEPLICLQLAYKNNPHFIDTVIKLNEHYPSTKEGYLRLREDYNIEPSPAKLQCLILRSNTNYMRFNKNGRFNVPYGERNHYNVQRMQDHKSAISSIEVFNLGYKELRRQLPSSRGGTTIKPNEYVFYSDCPYQGTTATYCEQGGWKDSDDEELLKEFLELQGVGCKVVASNVLKNRGVVNKRWVDFCEEYNDKFTVHHLNRDYNNSSFRKGNGLTDEVLIVSK